MAELLVRVVHKVNADPYLDSKCLKRGDVVTVQADGWGWGSEELTNPDWRIVRITGVTKTQAEVFLGHEINIDPAKPSRVLRRRAFTFDIDDASIPAAWRDWVADSTRALPIKVLSVSLPQLMALKKGKTRLVDPNVLG